MATTASIAILHGALATLTALGSVQVWHILLAVFLISSLQAFDQPSRQAIFPNLLDRRDLMKAVALNSTIHPGTRIFAPLISGVLIDRLGAGQTGAAAALYLVSACYLTFSLMMFRVRARPVSRRGGTNGFQDLKDGIRYVSQTHLFRFLIGMSYVHGFFGRSHIILLPVFAARLTDAASGSELGVLYSAAGAGGLVGALLGGLLARFRRRGLLVVGGGGAFGLFLIMFALSPWYGIAAGLELIASLFNQLFAVTAQSTLHGNVPDEYRGRVMGVWGLTHSLVQPLGGLAMGGAAGAVSAPFAVVVGGVVVALFGFLGAGRDRRIRGIGMAAAEPPPEN